MRGGGVVRDKTGLKIFVFINAMIFAFITFVTNTSLWGKTLLKSKKIFSKYLTSFCDAEDGQMFDF